MDSTLDSSAGRLATERRWTGRLIAAHVIAVALALLDLVTPSLMSDEGDFAPGTGGILVLGALGLLTLLGVGAHVRTRRRGWLRVVAATRTISALTAVPAFIVDGVPAVMVVGAAVCVAATIVDVVLLLSPGRP